VQPNVELDLTDYGTVYVAPGVHVSGGRTSRDPGARLYVRCTATATDVIDGLSLPQSYCASSPEHFLVTDGDGVRLSGLRIEGTDGSTTTSFTTTSTTVARATAWPWRMAPTP
jgi:hypothetical protein